MFRLKNLSEVVLLTLILVSNVAAEFGFNLQNKIKEPREDVGGRDKTT